MKPKYITMKNGSKIEPVITFTYGKDQSYPGAVVDDDGCLVLCIAEITNGKIDYFRWTTHIFPEAAKAMHEALQIYFHLYEEDY